MINFSNSFKTIVFVLLEIKLNLVYEL